MTPSAMSTVDGRVLDAKPTAFWTDRPDAPEPRPALDGAETVDLAIVGGGFSGLWAAVIALEEMPGLRVAVLESEICGFGASSRNGGFCDASLTHGLGNGLAHWPREIETLVRLGKENLDEISSTINRHELDTDFRMAGEIEVASQRWQLEDLVEGLEDLQRFDEVEFLDAEAMQSCIKSPTYLGGVRQMSGKALVDPARLVWRLAELAEKLGAVIFDRSPAKGLEASGSGIAIATPGGSLRADRVVVATNAYRAPVTKSEPVCDSRCTTTCL